MAFVKTKDGVQLHVKEMGKGRPVVLIHGGPLTGDMFELLISMLSAEEAAILERQVQQG